MNEQAIRFITVIISAASLPFVFSLLINTLITYKKSADKLVAFGLLLLFSVLFITTLMTLYISTIAYLVAGINFDYLSRLRSLFFSIGNFITSLFFWFAIKKNKIKK